MQYQLSAQDRRYKNDSLDKTYTIFEDNQYAGKSHFADAFFQNQFQKIYNGLLALILDTDPIIKLMYL